METIKKHWKQFLAYWLGINTLNFTINVSLFIFLRSLSGV